MCFGARYTQYGTFNAPLGGEVAAVKLVHLYGYVTSNKYIADHWSFWGSGHGCDLVDVVVTWSNNHMILPANQFIRNRAGKWSTEIILPVFSSPYSLSAQTQLRVWYFEDLMNYTESDNDGLVCADVYVLYV